MIEYLDSQHVSRVHTNFVVLGRITLIPKRCAQ